MSLSEKCKVNSEGNVIHEKQTYEYSCFVFWTVYFHN